MSASFGVPKTNVISNFLQIVNFAMHRKFSRCDADGTVTSVELILVSALFCVPTSKIYSHNTFQLQLQPIKKLSLEFSGIVMLDELVLG